MIEDLSLADIIQRKLYLGAANARGFHELRCEVCHDHSPRAGFRLDGDSVGFFCWNCGSKARYEERSGRLSKNFRHILSAFGITKDDLQHLRSSIFNQQKTEAREVTLDDLKKVKLHTPEVSLPDRCFPIGFDGHHEMQIPLVEYLESRKVDPLAIQAHFSLEQRFIGRVIIPFFRDVKIIYWQARHIDRAVKPRYLNSEIAKDAVMYGYDELFSWRDTPVFVNEGVFDAIAVSGVCTLGASLNSSKIEILKRCRRRIIFVVDRDSNGGIFGETALENGWEITYVDERADDASDSVVRFGLPYTIYTLLRNATRQPAYTEQNKHKLQLAITLGKMRRA